MEDFEREHLMSGISEALFDIAEERRADPGGADFYQGAAHGLNIAKRLVEAL